MDFLVNNYFLKPSYLMVLLAMSMVKKVTYWNSICKSWPSHYWALHICSAEEQMRERVSPLMKTNHDNVQQRKSV